MANPPTLCMVVSSAGSSKLERTLISLRRQRLLEGDQVVVVDFTTSASTSIIDRFRDSLPIDHVAYDPLASEVPENRAIDEAVAAERILWTRDGDVIAEGALDAIRAAAAEQSTGPMMFRFVRADRLVVWRRHEIAIGNIALSGFVTPSVAGQIGRWGNQSEREPASHDFITSTLALWPPGALSWRGEIVTICEPEDANPPWRAPGIARRSPFQELLARIQQ